MQWTVAFFCVPLQAYKKKDTTIPKDDGARTAGRDAETGLQIETGTVRRSSRLVLDDHIAEDDLLTDRVFVHPFEEPLLIGLGFFQADSTQLLALTVLRRQVEVQKTLSLPRFVLSGRSSIDDSRGIESHDDSPKDEKGLVAGFAASCAERKDLQRRTTLLETHHIDPLERDQSLKMLRFGAFQKLRNCRLGAVCLVYALDSLQVANEKSCSLKLLWLTDDQVQCPRHEQRALCTRTPR
jgi:hypothetical protein